MTRPAPHLDDEQLSTLVDEQLGPGEQSRVDDHLARCSVCRERLEEFRSVAALLHGLPQVDPPREFRLGPRPIADPRGVIRLRRWYLAARVTAAALAAVFVALSGGALYVDSQPVAPATVQLTQPRLASAPAAQSQAPAAPAAAKPAAPAAGAAARPVASPQPDDQVAAATSVSPLPTQVPTPSPTLAPVGVAAAPAATATDPGGPLRYAAVVAGVLAVATLLAAFVVRHRLQNIASHP